MQPNAFAELAEVEFAEEDLFNCWPCFAVVWHCKSALDTDECQLDSVLKLFAYAGSKTCAAKAALNIADSDELQQQAWRSHPEWTWDQPPRYKYGPSHGAIHASMTEEEAELNALFVTGAGKGSTAYNSIHRHTDTSQSYSEGSSRCTLHSQLDASASLDARFSSSRDGDIGAMQQSERELPRPIHEQGHCKFTPDKGARDLSMLFDNRNCPWGLPAKSSCAVFDDEPLDV